MSHGKNESKNICPCDSITLALHGHQFQNVICLTQYFHNTYIPTLSDKHSIFGRTIPAWFSDNCRGHFGHISMCPKARGIQGFGGGRPPRKLTGILSASDAASVRSWIERCPFFVRLYDNISATVEKLCLKALGLRNDGRLQHHKAAKLAAFLL